MRLCHLVGSPTRTHCRLTCFEHLFVSVDLFQVPPFKSKHNLLVPVHFRPRRSGSQPTGGHFGSRALVKRQGAIRRSRASWPYILCTRQGLCHATSAMTPAALRARLAFRDVQPLIQCPSRLPATHVLTYLQVARPGAILLIAYRTEGIAGNRNSTSGVLSKFAKNSRPLINP